MSFDYAELARDALETLQEFGSPGQVKRKEQGEYTPGLGAAPVTEMTQGLHGVVFPIKASLINGTTVLASDETAIVSTVGVIEPRATDVLAINGKTYTIMGVRWTSPAGVAVVGELQVRR